MSSWTKSGIWCISLSAACFGFAMAHGHMICADDLTAGLMFGWLIFGVAAVVCFVSSIVKALRRDHAKQ